MTRRIEVLVLRLTVMNLFAIVGVANQSMALMLADNRQFSAAFDHFNGAPVKAQQIYRLLI
ncbi:hypothetical protein [Endozoicomonas sp. GU-1]|uniref:hypothetical protein n=1 Tax=Endozoicomonas sp. GU-1 TaxID=3009078 RepID=UPI0022B57BA4|nr:hypothetical protein [Endozoicomonas sp. GU-1]WBA87364.1 hypothetical protein O3276_04850 [Endozoicomonas sp. GU-1]